MTTDPQLSLSQIGQIAIPVHNLERAVAFYRDSLGLRFLFQAPPGLAFFDCSGVRLMLDAAAEGFKDHSSVLYFKVPDIKKAFAALRERRVSFQDEPHLIHKDVKYELWMAFFYDPDRNLLAIMSEIPI